MRNFPNFDRILERVKHGGNYSMTLRFEPVEASEKNLLAHVDLFKKCFPSSANLSRSYLNWLYLENPAGKVCGFDAFDQNELVATYVCIPTLLSLRGKPLRGLLSLNTATAPSHQGRGLFTQLATQTYDFGQQQGYEVVYGIANQNSIGGFVRKLGFQDVTPLDARVGFANSPKINASVAEEKSEFFRLWDYKSISWRLANPKNPLVITASSTGHEIYGNTHLPLTGISAYVTNIENIPIITRKKRPFEVYIGKVPHDCWERSMSIAIPDRLKPSPLRLIYRSLINSSDTIAAEKTYIRFIDFDAF